MRKYIIMGVQGCRKGTHAKLLAESLDLEHINVGDIFRWNIQHHTKLGIQVRRSVAAGELVADDLVAAVVHRRLSEHNWNFGFIIDGFPATSALPADQGPGSTEGMMMTLSGGRPVGLHPNAGAGQPEVDPGAVVGVVRFLEPIRRIGGGVQPVAA